MSSALTQVELIWPKNPYKGLSYYGPADRPLYAGRDADIRRCGALLMLPETRTLILHGKTGCGKSSFLRAGLIPTVEAEGFAYEFLKIGPADNPKVVFIRCTNAPVKQLAGQVFDLMSSKHEVHSPVGRRTVDLRPSLKGVGAEAFRDRASEEGFLIGMLQEISLRLPKTLIFVLDQAEEVLTLNPSDDLAGDRLNFFSFLQEFNSVAIDVKLVIALRTEYYGRFFNAMNIDYRVRSDAKEYLLEDLNEKMLAEAIERPTLEKEVPPWGTPFAVYRFHFEAGLPSKIAKDLLEAKQTGGVLPVMQIVCKSLYDEIATRETNRVVTRSQYEALGGVHGRIHEHIHRSLLEAFHLQKLAQNQADQEEEKWRLIICKLAAVQEDGTVTTNVLPADVLRDEAREQGTRLAPDGVLEYLASPEVLLLRKLSLLNLGAEKPVESFSLGHDAIGLSLNRWRVTNEETRKHKKQMRKVQIYTIAIGIIFCGTFLLYFLNQRSQKAAVVHDNAQRIALQATAQGPEDYQLSLLLAIAANRLLSDAKLDSVPEVQKALIQALVSAPDYVVNFANATGTDKVDDFSLRGTHRLLTNGQRLIVRTLDPRYTPQVAQVDLNRNDATVSPVPTGSVKPGPAFRTTWYWSLDGTHPLFLSADQIEVTVSGVIQAISRSSFMKLITGLPPIPKTPTGGTRIQGIWAFGRENFLVYRCTGPPLICQTWPLNRSDPKQLSYSVGEPFEGPSVYGNRSTLMLQTKADVGSEIQLWNLARDQRLSLFNSHERVRMDSQFPLVDPKADKNEIVIPHDTIAFSTDDSIVAFLAAAPSGRLSLSVVRSDWPANHRAIQQISVDPGDKPASLRVGVPNSHLFLVLKGKEGTLQLANPDPANNLKRVFLFGTKDIEDMMFVEGAAKFVALNQTGLLMVWSTELEGKTARIEEKPLSEMIKTACNLVRGRQLTEAESLQYIGSKKLGSLCDSR